MAPKLLRCRLFRGGEGLTSTLGVAGGIFGGCHLFYVLLQSVLKLGSQARKLNSHSNSTVAGPYDGWNGYTLVSEPQGDLQLRADGHWEHRFNITPPSAHVCRLGTHIYSGTSVSMNFQGIGHSVAFETPLILVGTA